MRPRSEPVARDRTWRSARELELLAALQTGNAEVVQRARPPTSASSPKPMRSIAIAFVLGLLLAVGLTLIREQLDRRLRDPEVTELLDVSVLSVIAEERGVPVRHSLRHPVPEARHRGLQDVAHQSALLQRRRGAQLDPRDVRRAGGRKDLDRMEPGPCRGEGRQARAVHRGRPAPADAGDPPGRRRGSLTHPRRSDGPRRALDRERGMSSRPACRRTRRS